MDFDRSIIGQTFDETTFEPVTREQILEFAAALGETHPFYTDEEAARNGPFGGFVAPPTFCTKFRGRRSSPNNLPRFGKVGLDAGRDVELYAPIRPGDVLTMVSSVDDIYEKTGRSGSMYFIVLRNVLTNQRGEKVAVIDHRIMQR